MDNNISFSKIVATPTLNSWSQAYNAGKLFAVLSLEKTQELTPEIESLNILGKDLLERLEQEFFAIEDKNLESIKTAISSIFANSPENVTISFAAGAFVNNILYLFGLGNAKVFIKRGNSLGLAMDAENVASKEIISSSGFLKEKDLIVLATSAFSEIITQDELTIGLNGFEPTEITESLAPKIHQAENGKISAIVIRYHNPLPNPTDLPDDLDEGIQSGDAIIEEAVIETEEKVPATTPLLAKSKLIFNKYLTLLKSKSAGWRTNLKIKPSKKLFLIIAVAIVGILAVSISFAIQEQKASKARELFAQVYPEAQKKYDEGQGLIDLNKNFARDSFTAAQKILNDNLASFPAKSKELTQAQDLLDKIADGMSQVSPIDKSGLDRSTLSITVLNGSGVEGTAGKAANILKDFGYNVISTGNGDNYNYVGVTIKIKSENSTFINLLKQDLSRDYTVNKTSSDLSADSSPSAVIIVGK